MYFVNFQVTVGFSYKTPEMRIPCLFHCVQRFYIIPDTTGGGRQIQTSPMSDRNNTKSLVKNKRKHLNQKKEKKNQQQTPSTHQPALHAVRQCICQAKIHFRFQVQHCNTFLVHTGGAVDGGRWVGELELWLYNMQHFVPRNPNLNRSSGALAFTSECSVS